MASLCPKQRKRIARKGGRVSQKLGRAHIWKTSEDALRAALLKSKFYGRLFANKPPPVKSTMTVREVVDFLGLSVRTIHNRLADGKLYGKKKGKKLQITTASVIALRQEYKKLF